MKRIVLPLFWKFAIAILFTVAVFGIVNLYLINYAVYDLFQKELNRHGKLTASSIAERSVDLIVYNDLATLNQYVNEQKQIDSNIAYVFILGQHDKILAHSFQGAVPSKLIKQNTPSEDENFSILKIKRKDMGGALIRDIAVPILKGRLGVVRIGFFEDDYYQSVKRTRDIFLIMVMAFSLIGIFGAFFFSYIITTPIKKISTISKKLELGSLELQETAAHIDREAEKPVNLKNILNVQDEIDYLADSFYEMVSRLQKAYSELQITQSSLFQSEKMASLGTLSSGLAHEINNPLAGIQNCISRLKESPENLKQNIAYLEMMEDALTRIKKVVGGLLDFARKPVMSFKKENMVEIVESVLLLTAYKFENERVSINKDFNNRPRYIFASRNHIEQVVLNLVLNSIEAIQEKKINSSDIEGEIFFGITENENTLEFEITDNGIGVEQDKLTKMFDPFYSNKSIRQGTGLGLSVCYTIVEQHQGKIISKNNSMGGMTMIVTLPKFEKDENNKKQEDLDC